MAKKQTAIEAVANDRMTLVSTLNNYRSTLDDEHPHNAEVAKMIGDIERAAQFISDHVPAPFEVGKAAQETQA